MNAPTERRPFGFLKTTLLGALLVVVPIGIIAFTLWQIAVIAKGVLGPVFGILPFDSSVTRIFAIAAALAAVVLLCYFTGLLVRTRWGRKLRNWVERRLLNRIPGYRMIRSAAHQYLGHDEDEEQFRPVIVDLHGTGARAVGFEIEAFDENHVAVYLPSVPAVTLGRLQVVPRDRVSPLPASMHDTIEALSTFGVGVGKLGIAAPGAESAEE